MTPESAADAVQRARDALTEYAFLRADLVNRVRTAYALGIPKTDIAQLAGIARTTVDRLLENHPGGKR